MTDDEAKRLADLIEQSRGLRRVYAGQFGADRTEKLERRQKDAIVVALRALVALREVVEWADGLRLYSEPGSELAPVFQRARAALKGE